MAEEEAPAPEENAEATEAAVAGTEAAAEAPAEAGPPPSLWKPVILSSVISIAGVVLVFKFLFMPMISGEIAKLDPNATDKKSSDHEGEGKHGDEEEEEPAEDNSKGEIPIVEEGDNIVTNVAGSNGTRYLMVEIFLKRGRKDDKLFRDHIKANSKKFKKIVIDRISVLDMQECGDPSVRSRIMAQLQSAFQIVLDDSYGQGKHPIKELILATWVMQ